MSDVIFQKYKRQQDELLNTALLEMVQAGHSAHKIIADLSGLAMLAVGFAATQRMSALLQLGDDPSTIVDVAHKEACEIFGTDGMQYVRTILQERADLVQMAIKAAHESVGRNGTAVAYIKNGKVEVPDKDRVGVIDTDKTNLH